jgi:hypothetical protein
MEENKMNNVDIYLNNRDKIKAGDIIAFGGNWWISNIVKWATGGPVSHVGIVLETKVVLGDNPQPGRIVQLIESTSLNGFNGVTINRLSERLKVYDGEAWWLPLSDEVRTKFDEKTFFDFMLHQEGKRYDFAQVIQAGIDIPGWLISLSKRWPQLFNFLSDLAGIFQNKEDLDRYFCSELAGAGLKIAGVLRDNTNVSELSPMDLVRFNLYSEYVQFIGEPKRLPGFATREVL